MVYNIDLRVPLLLYTYKAYLEGHIIKTPYKGYITPGQYLDKLIHIDIVGLLYTIFNGSKYFIYFYYNKTKEVKYYIINTRLEALAKFKLFQASY